MTDFLGFCLNIFNVLNNPKESEEIEKKDDGLTLMEIFLGERDAQFLVHWTEKAKKKKVQKLERGEDIFTLFFAFFIWYNIASIYSSGWPVLGLILMRLC